MKVEKEFTVALTVEDPITYSLDIENRVNSALKTLYLGKCYKGCFIEQILKVLHVSECMIYNCDTGRGCITVRFLALVVTYTRGDIVYAATIRGERAKMYSMEGPNFAALVAANPRFPVKPDMKVPICILNISFTPYHKMAINGEFYLPQTRTIAYSMGQTTGQVKSTLSGIYADLGRALKERDTLRQENPKGYGFFAKIQYALPTYPPEPYELPPGVTEIDALDMDALIKYSDAGYCAVISPVVPPDSTAIWVCEKPSLPEGCLKVNEDGHDDVLVDLYYGMVKRAEFIPRMCEAYPPELLRANIGVWAAYAAYKK